MKSDQMRGCCIGVLVFLIVIMMVRCMLKRNRRAGHSNTCGHKQAAAPIKAETAKHPMYIVYGYMSCPYTAKQVTYMESHGIPHTFVDTKTETGATELNEITGGGTGVPVIVNTSTSQFKVGYTEL
mgnify:CR=1 FL=1|tara:strand:- start:400 stop:777 length:378 start_codon:yes stop_codon:yes gene_type:complete